MAEGPDLVALREKYLAAGRPLAHLPRPRLVNVWTDNAAAIALWMQMQGQWLMGPSGPIALRLEAMPQALRLARIRRRDRAAAQSGLKVMESAALDYLAEQSKKAQNDLRRAAQKERERHGSAK